MNNKKRGVRFSSGVFQPVTSKKKHRGQQKGGVDTPIGKFNKKKRKPQPWFPPQKLKKGENGKNKWVPQKTAPQKGGNVGGVGPHHYDGNHQTRKESVPHDGKRVKNFKGKQTKGVVGVGGLGLSLGWGRAQNPQYRKT